MPSFTSLSSPPFSLPCLHTPLNPTLSTFSSRFPLNSKPEASVAFHLRIKNPVRARNSTLRVSCMRESRAAVVTKDSWEKSVLNSQVPVLVEFYASWCGPCKMVHRVIDEIAEEYAGRLNCFVLNADNDLKVAEDYEIKAVPVVFLFKNGEKCDSVIGTMPKEFYVAAIERVLKS